MFLTSEVYVPIEARLNSIWRNQLHSLRENLKFEWGRYDALWLPRNLFNEQKQRGLPSAMNDLGSAHGIFIIDPSQNSDELRIGGANLQLAYDYLIIYTFWIEVSHRRKSLGRKLLDEVEQFGRKNSKRRILLSTFEFQDGLQFWKACGFNEVGRVEDYPEGQRLIYLHKRL